MIVVSVCEVSSVFDLVSLVFLISTLGELVSSFRFVVVTGVSLFSAGFSCVGGLEVCGLGSFLWASSVVGLGFSSSSVSSSSLLPCCLCYWSGCSRCIFFVLSRLSVSMSSSFSSLSDSQIPLMFFIVFVMFRFLFWIQVFVFVSRVLIVLSSVLCVKVRVELQII